MNTFKNQSLEEILFEAYEFWLVLKPFLRGEKFGGYYSIFNQLSLNKYQIRLFFLIRQFYINF
jgi:hypothetical protein